MERAKLRRARIIALVILALFVLSGLVALLR
jgi:hypothetical protein